jgi:3-oxoacyl-[acyl-carrier-protein] synthase III
MTRARILGISGFVPEYVETNDELARANPDWDMERIGEKTGIRARHIAAENETANDLALAAARMLLDRNLVPIETIDFLLVCTQTPDHLLPANACLLQHKLQLSTHLAALDFNSGCSGYVHGLQLAASLIESQAAQCVLLITADTYSKVVHPLDRTVRSLFGDAATATLIGPAEETQPGAIGPFIHGTDGSGAGELIIPAGGFRLPRSERTQQVTRDAQGCVRSPEHLFMNGQAVFSFALSRVPAAISQLQQTAGVTTGEIDWYIFHQANRFMLESLAVVIQIPTGRMVYHLDDVGNTVSSSIPLAIEAHEKSGRILPGQRLLLAGFGVGLSWGACLVKWG